MFSGKMSIFKNGGSAHIPLRSVFYDIQLKKIDSSRDIL